MPLLAFLSHSMRSMSIGKKGNVDCMRLDPINGINNNYSSVGNDFRCVSMWSLNISAHDKSARVYVCGRAIKTLKLIDSIVLYTINSVWGWLEPEHVFLLVCAIGRTNFIMGALLRSQVITHFFLSFFPCLLSVRGSWKYALLFATRYHGWVNTINEW